MSGIDILMNETIIAITKSDAPVSSRFMGESILKGLEVDLLATKI